METGTQTTKLWAAEVLRDSLEKHWREGTNFDCLLPMLRALVLGVCFFTAAGPCQAQVFTDPVCRLPTMPEGVEITGKLEYDVKAAVLYRCLEFVQWPQQPAAANGQVLKVGLLGKNRFGESLESIVGKSVAGRKLQVQKVSKLARAAHCQLVFVSSSESNRTERILADLRSFPVLTVGETPGFTQKGGMINLLLDGRTLRLEVNAEAAQQAGLTLAPTLIKLGELSATPAASTQPQTTSSASTGPSG